MQVVDEKREFLRVDYDTQLDYKVLNGDKFTTKNDVFSRNMSACGLLFRTFSEAGIPAISNIVWIKLDEKMLNICTEIESDLIIHKGGVLGRVVRIAEGEPGKSFDIGVCFLRRKDMTEHDVQALLI